MIAPMNPMASTPTYSKLAGSSSSIPMRPAAALSQTIRNAAVSARPTASRYAVLLRKSPPGRFSSVVRDDQPLDDLGFGCQELRQVIPHEIRSQMHGLVSAGL